MTHVSPLGLSGLVDVDIFAIPERFMKPKSDPLDTEYEGRGRASAHSVAVVWPLSPSNVQTLMRVWTS